MNNLEVKINIYDINGKKYKLTDEGILPESDSIPYSKIYLNYITDNLFCIKDENNSMTIGLLDKKTNERITKNNIKFSKHYILCNDNNDLSVTMFSNEELNLTNFNGISFERYNNNNKPGRNRRIIDFDDDDSNKNKFYIFLFIFFSIIIFFLILLVILLIGYNIVKKK